MLMWGWHSKLNESKKLGKSKMELIKLWRISKLTQSKYLIIAIE